VPTRSAFSAVLLLPIAVSFSLACRTPQNYLDPALPLYEGTFGAQPPSRPEIRVVTFNVEYALHVPEAIAALRSEPELRAPDLLLLQEMDAPGVEAVARALRLNYVYCPSSVHPVHKRDIGAAVLSPWPIEESAKVLLPHTSRFSGHARAAVAATVLVAGQRVRVYCLHLGTPINLGKQARLDQLEAVLADAAAHDGFVVIGGDFNSRGMAERVAKRGFEWATRDIGRTTALFSFDHILSRGFGTGRAPQTGVVRQVKGVSDHSPAWAVLSLE